MNLIAKFPEIQILPNLDAQGNTLAMVRKTFKVLTPTQINIPSGFIFDGASIPKALWRFLGHPLHAQYLVAACVHDYVYSTAILPRAEADFIFYTILKQNKVNPLRSFLMYLAVRIFGKSHYKGK